MFDNGNDLEFTNAGWEALYRAVDSRYFQDQDAEMIYESLRGHLRTISFGDYLKRYIYRKAELTGEYTEIPLAEYQFIIREAFREHHTPASFTPTTAKLSALSKNWLTQRTVKRNVVFLLGFGLGMSVEDVNLFLTKALREPEINPKDPFEAICWYCYKNGYSYLKYEKLWDIYLNTPPGSLDMGLLYGDYTIGYRVGMQSLHNDAALIAHLAGLKNADNVSAIGLTAREEFQILYDEARDIVAGFRNHTEEERHEEARNEYKRFLAGSDRLSDAEKQNRLHRFDEGKRVYNREDIMPADMESVICAAIPTDRHGNLTPSKASRLNEQFEGRRFSRQRIGEILAGSTQVNRFDLITLNFFNFSQKLEQYPNAKQRYSAFLDTTNAILENCSMGKLYVQNPYECFVLMCILSQEPLATYADVWELSYLE